MTLTLAQAKKLRHGQTVYTPGYYNSDGTAQRWRVSGKVQLWKTQPGRIRVPIKHGLYDHFEITERNLSKFSLKEPAKKKKR